MAMTKPLRVAIVGCGKIADGHVEEIGKLPGASVAAVCDRELLMAEQLAVRHGLPAFYDDFEKMLDVEHPDIVHVATPPQSHVALARTAIGAGCHVYIEKPIAPTSKEARELIAEAETNNKKLTVGYTYYYDPPAEALRKMIAAGEIGDPVHVESYYGYDLEGGFGRAVMSNPGHWVHSLPGKLFHNNLDHALNKITEFVTDDDPTILARALRLQPSDDAREQMMDELRVIVLGKKTSAYVTFSSHAKPVGHFMRIYGTRRSAHVDFVSRSISIDDAIALPGAIGRALAPFGKSWGYFRAGGRNVIRFARSDFHYFAGLNRLLALFYDAVRDDSPPPITYRDILRITKMQETIYDQINATKGVEAQ